MMIIIRFATRGLALALASFVLSPLPPYCSNGCKMLKLVLCVFWLYQPASFSQSVRSKSRHEKKMNDIYGICRLRRLSAFECLLLFFLQSHLRSPHSPARKASNASMGGALSPQVKARPAASRYSCYMILLKVLLFSFSPPRVRRAGITHTLYNSRIPLHHFCVVLGKNVEKKHETPPDLLIKPGFGTQRYLILVTAVLKAS